MRTVQTDIITVDLLDNCRRSICGSTAAAENTVENAFAIFTQRGKFSKIRNVPPLLIVCFAYFILQSHTAVVYQRHHLLLRIWPDNSIVTKNKPFIGNKLTPDQYLKVELKQTDKMWYFSHPEIRNFKTIEYSLDNANGNPVKKQGLYSTDGFIGCRRQCRDDGV